MKSQIFKTARRGLLGSKPMGAEYMQDVNERAKRMRAAVRVEPTRNTCQLRLPFVGKVGR